MGQGEYDERMIFGRLARHECSASGVKQLILALSPEEQTWLKAQLIQSGDHTRSKGVIDLNSFSSVIQLKEEPITFQCRIRDEWT